MIELKGKYNTAKVFTDEIEESAVSQIIGFLNHIAFKSGNIAIMPDAHYGRGAVIGFTAPLSNKVIANVIGVDIACGVTAWKLGKRSTIGERFDRLDTFIKERIPSGKNVRKTVHPELHKIYNKMSQQIGYDPFMEVLQKACTKTGQDFARVLYSIGSLGGGNHFIEVDKDDNDDLWLIIHSGSRNFGLQIATWHQKRAIAILNEERKDAEKAKIEIIKNTVKAVEIEQKLEELQKSRVKVSTELAYLSDGYAANYIDDMKIAQAYAALNRRTMGYEILTRFYNLDPFKIEVIASVHNYINFSDNIIRKGAISAHKDERVIIPLNMADGCIIGIGKGNAAWNYSAPHGAGRLMSRTAAKANISLEDFQRRMRDAGVWTSCVGKGTLDEAPQAYKKADHIIAYLKDTVDIVVHMKPIYNFKAQEGRRRDKKKRHRR